MQPVILMSYKMSIFYLVGVL